MEGYACKKCGAPARVDDCGIERSCGCNTTVVATMTATVYGEGHASEGPESLFAVFHRIGLEALKAIRARV